MDRKKKKKAAKNFSTYWCITMDSRKKKKNCIKVLYTPPHYSYYPKSSTGSTHVHK